jgi:hypothetical protein
MEPGGHNQIHKVVDIHMPAIPAGIALREGALAPLNPFFKARPCQVYGQFEFRKVIGIDPGHTSGEKHASYTFAGGQAVGELLRLTKVRVVFVCAADG